MTSGTRQSDSKQEQKRRDYRVATELELRLRLLSEQEVEQTGPDPVALYEELTLAQARFRKELSPAGRGFVDKLMATVDALTGIAAGNQNAAGWTPHHRTSADLSAGGLGFISSTAFELDAHVEIEFSVVEGSSTVPFRCKAVVVRANAAGEGTWDIGVSFSDISATTQRRLVRVVLELQRVQLRNQGGAG